MLTLKVGPVVKGHESALLKDEGKKPWQPLSQIMRGNYCGRDQGVYYNYPFPFEALLDY